MVSTQAILKGTGLKKLGLKAIGFKQLTIGILMLTNFLSLTAFSSTSQAQEKQLLMIISGNGGSVTNQQLTENKVEKSSHKKQKHSGYEFDEFAKAYLVFKENGIKVDVASPQGGNVKASKFNAKKKFNTMVLKDKTAMHALENSIAFANVNTASYDAIFVVGGGGAMYDLPDDKNLQNIIKNIYENNGSVAAVCHGPAALVNVKLSNGKYLVANRKVNSFTNLEENILDEENSKNYPFLLQNKLIQRGGKFESAPLLMSHSASDQRLITGQNQHSTGDTAVDLLRSMGLSDIKRPAFNDEASMVLVRRYLAGDNDAIADFHKNTQLYMPSLIAQYANAYAGLAKNEQDIEKAVVLMEMAMQHWQHPRLSLSLAKNLMNLGRLTQAESILIDLIQHQPKLSQRIKNKVEGLLAKIKKAGAKMSAVTSQEAKI